VNVTLSIDEKTLKRAREVARRQGKSLNQLVREYMQGLAGERYDEQHLRDLFDLMDEGGGSLEGRGWSRDDIHGR